MLTLNCLCFQMNASTAALSQSLYTHDNTTNNNNKKLQLTIPPSLPQSRKVTWISKWEQICMRNAVAPPNPPPGVNAATAYHCYEQKEKQQTYEYSSHVPQHCMKTSKLYDSSTVAAAGYNNTACMNISVPHFYHHHQPTMATNDKCNMQLQQQSFYQLPATHGMRNGNQAFLTNSQRQTHGNM